MGDSNPTTQTNRSFLSTAFTTVVFNHSTNLPIYRGGIRTHSLVSFLVCARVFKKLSYSTIELSDHIGGI